jgi:hypothetical protein
MHQARVTAQAMTENMLDIDPDHAPAPAPREATSQLHAKAAQLLVTPPIQRPNGSDPSGWL